MSTLTLETDKTLASLFGISTDKNYQEYNIVMLLDKDKLSKNYPIEIPFYEEKLNIEGNLYGDFACVILPSEKVTKSKKSFKLSSPMYIKRFSGILKNLKSYFDKHETYARRVKEETGVYCSFNSGGVIINILFHNETDHRTIDKFVLNTIEQLIYITQVGSGQLMTVILKDQTAIMGDKTTCPVSEILDKVIEKQEQNVFLSASCDMLNSNEYCFDFTEKDSKIPKKYEKHCIITGTIDDTNVFTKLTEICTKVNVKEEPVNK